MSGARLIPWIALGGSLGAAASLGVTAPANGGLGPSAFSLSDAAAGVVLAGLINVVGSFGLGLLRGRARRAGRPRHPRLDAALGVGFLGSFTSFTAVSSTLALLAAEVALGMEPAGWWILALMGTFAPVLLLLLSLILGTMAAGIGLRLGSGPAGNARAERT